MGELSSRQWSRRSLNICSLSNLTMAELLYRATGPKLPGLDHEEAGSGFGAKTASSTDQLGWPVSAHQACSVQPSEISLKFLSLKVLFPGNCYISKIGPRDRCSSIKKGLYIFHNDMVVLHTDFTFTSKVNTLFRGFEETYLLSFSLSCLILGRKIGTHLTFAKHFVFISDGTKPFRKSVSLFISADKGERVSKTTLNRWLKHCILICESQGLQVLEGSQLI